MYKDYRLIEYVEAVDSIQPAPGGGSVSGLVGALGTALVRMYGHLTTNKKKFQALDRDKQRAFLDHFEKLSALQNDLIENVDLDAQAYELVMSAYRMKNETEEEKDAAKRYFICNLKSNSAADDYYGQRNRSIAPL